jgi:hypothetical protein
MRNYIPIVISLVALLVGGCRDRDAEARKAKEDADAKARADAARKEMETAPKVFKSRDYFKQNEPDKKGEIVPEEKKPNQP